jgi:5-guanidino-2-oxopentanoate decarboxylase
MESAVMTGAEALVRSLVAHDVRVAFGIPGTHNLEIYRHLPRYGVRHVTPRHEQGAGTPPTATRARPGASASP